MIMARVRIPPPPRPWIARKMISWIMVCASAHARLPKRKMIRLPRRTLLRPKMSLRRPYTGCSAVEVSMYAVPTHEAIDAWLKILPRVGRAVATLVVSRGLRGTKIKLT